MSLFAAFEPTILPAVPQHTLRNCPEAISHRYGFFSIENSLKMAKRHRKRCRFGSIVADAMDNKALTELKFLLTREALWMTNSICIPGRTPVSRPDGIAVIPEDFQYFVEYVD